ncbi:hypothetical protein K458DRAFT_298358 [Lentithecium fluviatile CBS 122367]|uniref:Arrestin C-terminal-like domain-containing protein n=1 Tax=Lentithecium fluviatile CBS 122367 TaxID=1168545 RepID=A0A6G1J648_9PLEO|nr:hypothetical protein K458DRAFT_298358 [Lentithecium fluviatile CBS 122367]
MPLTLSDIAGRMLKGSGHPQPPPGKGPPSEVRPSLERASVSSHLASPGSELVACGGMVGNSFGEPRGPSSHVASWAKTRPLSDIRELTEPSLADTIPRRLPPDSSLPRSTSRSELSRKPSVASRRPSIDTRFAENREPDRKPSIDSNYARPAHRGRPASRTPSPPSPADLSISSIYSIPPGSIPPRSSSRVRARSASRTRQPPSVPPISITQRVPVPPSLSTVPSLPPPPPRGAGDTIPQRGKSQSPLRHVVARLDPISHDTHRRIPSRTFIREPLSAELLEFPTHRHPRVHLGLDLSASIFVGGGSIEGTVQIQVDDAERIRHRKTLAIARISIDLLGLEEMTGNRRSVFLNLATELIDENNPPPHNMIDSQEQIGHDDPFWTLMPSISNLPFMMSLPLNVGPPPFQSKNARIRYVLCVSLLIRDQGKQYIVRASEDISVLSVYDPEKALMSLPSPLTASDEWLKPRDATVEVVRVTAGLHRQVWVSGTSIYVDVHIANNSRKTIKKIELQLERDILCYKHAAASTMEKSASQARIFDSNERSILSKAITKQGAAGWHGVPAHHTHIRTCDLEVPRGHGTVKCGKYFEVRYFLNVIVGSSHTKLVSVQLPIVLIHMNSLDIVPNSVAQVAAAIEEKRTAHTYQRGHSPSRLGRRPSRSVQGRAFAAPRMQSLDRMRAQAEDLQELGQVLDQSPRKCSLRRMTSNWDYHTPPSNRKGKILADGDVADLQNRLRRVRSNETIGSKNATMNRGNSMKSRRGCGSSLGFREAEVREDIELGGLGISGETPFKQRLERSRERQYRFTKKRSVERWKDVANVGVGWLKGNGGGKDERERDGWI